MRPIPLLLCAVSLLYLASSGYADENSFRNLRVELIFAEEQSSLPRSLVRKTKAALTSAEFTRAQKLQLLKLLNSAKVSIRDSDAKGETFRRQSSAARRAIARKPEEFRPYLKLFIAAKRQGSDSLGEIAREILNSNAPAKAKELARRHLNGTDAALSRIDLIALGLDHNNKSPIVFYLWSLERLPHWTITSGALEDAGIVTVGYCLDQNIELATEVASSFDLNTTLHYAEPGKAGRHLEDLIIGGSGSIVFLAPDGAILDRNGHREYTRKIKRLMAQQQEGDVE